MTDDPKMFDPDPELDMAALLEGDKELFFSIPEDASPAVKAALLKLVGGVALQVEVKQAIRPMLDNMKFDLDAAERGAITVDSGSKH